VRTRGLLVCRKCATEHWANQPSPMLDLRFTGPDLLLTGETQEEKSENDWWVEKVGLMGVNGRRWKSVMLVVGVMGKVKSILNDILTCACGGPAAAGGYLRFEIPSVGDPHSCLAYCLRAALDRCFVGRHLRFTDVRHRRPPFSSNILDSSCTWAVTRA
ncbi:hypothetical protein HAX54_001560, partial [Datura stramonium]|nr:hypothetical protein [Datura stramonium]